MVLMRLTVKAENSSTASDQSGRDLIVNLSIQDAPNDQDLQADFYTQLTRKLRPDVNSNLVLAGHLTSPVENIDKNGGTEISSRKNAFQSIVEMSNN